MARKTARKIRQRRRVRPVTRRTRAPKPTLPVQVAPGFTVRTLVQKEYSLLPTAAEAGYRTIPLNPNAIPELKTTVTGTRYWRVTNISIGAEPAHSTSTQLCGLSPATTSAETTGTGYGNVYKRLRYCTKTKRSPVGGNLQVTWPVNMAWQSASDSTTTTSVPGVVFAVTNPSTISSSAWFELILTVQAVGGV